MYSLHIKFFLDKHLPTKNEGLKLCDAYASLSLVELKFLLRNEKIRDYHICLGTNLNSGKVIFDHLHEKELRLSDDDEQLINRKCFQSVEMLCFFYALICPLMTKVWNCYVQKRTLKASPNFF